MTRNQPLAIVFGLIVLFLLGSSFLHIFISVFLRLVESHAFF